MKLTTAQTDRAVGALLASAVGDALGVPYEFGTAPGAGELAEMKGGGCGPFKPGEWSDDTSMAVCIAEVAATGADLTTDEALDAIAERFLLWAAGPPLDIGIQTSAVLRAAGTRVASGEERPARVLREEATAYAARNSRSAGNGALMRTAPVALAHLDDRDKLADAARLVAGLTHADPLAGDSCVLWCEAIRVAVLEGRFDLRSGLDLLPADRSDQWEVWVDDALAGSPERFRANGYTVTALQAAAAAIVATPVSSLEPSAGSFPCRHLPDALHAAIRIGHDTDTVAAIAGALLGARWGASAVPWRWRRAVHGWPGRDGRDLVSLATLTVRGGHAHHNGWPTVDDVPYSEPAASRPVPHPYDDGVLLGTHASVGHDADAVVSMCRVGRHQKCFDGATEVVESRLMDSEVADDNPNLHFVLFDTADAVRGLRAEGKRVLLHCVAAQQRTPSVAVAYAVLMGHEASKSRADVLAALPDARGRGRVWRAGGSLLSVK